MDGGLDDAPAAALVDAIADWRDADDLRRPNGAEAPEYRAANLKYVPANAPFETIGDVARVLGMTQAVFQRIAPLITVYSRRPGINPATAARGVLLALPDATPEMVDAYIDQRAQALAGKLPAPPFPPAQAYASGAGARLAHPGTGVAAGWCNLRPRSRAASVARRTTAAGRARLARAVTTGGRTLPFIQRSLMAVIADSTSFKTTAYPRSLARRLGLTGFGHWWRSELAAAMPERLRAALERRRARPVLAFDGSVATLWRPAQANGRLSMREVARIAPRR